MQSVPITTKVVSSNPTHGEVYSIQHYVIKFFSDLRQVSGFHRFPPLIKLTATITELLLKVSLNTITLNPNPILIYLILVERFTLGLLISYRGMHTMYTNISYREFHIGFTDILQRYIHCYINIIQRYQLLVYKCLV